MRKSKVWRRVEEARGMPLGDVLRDLYINQGKTLDDCGKELGVSASTVWWWLKRLGIPTRQLMLPPEEGSNLASGQ